MCWDLELKKIQALYYSATGVTDRVVHTLAEALAQELGLPLSCRGFTTPAERAAEWDFGPDTLAVIGSPTYAGKLPNKLLPDFKRLRGCGALAVPVVTFGNRAYENSLAELCAVLEAGGFHTIAAGAFVGRHAFTDQLADGRPDFEDRRKLGLFARDIAGKVRALDAIPPAVQVPGDADAPYYIPKGIDGEPVRFLKAKPQTDLSKCCNCGACARLCPMGAIDPKNVAETPGTCIKCQRCVRKCTHHAKYFDDAAFLSHVAMLEANYQERKENAVFL